MRTIVLLHNVEFAGCITCTLTDIPRCEGLAGKDAVRVCIPAAAAFDKSSNARASFLVTMGAKSLIYVVRG